MTPPTILMLVALVVLVPVNGSQDPGLKLGFYNSSCRNAEVIVRDIVWNYTTNKPQLAAKILRMLFHDYFIRGCNAPVLLNVRNSQKKANPNKYSIGFKIIDEVKLLFEKECPGIVSGIVSCTDILALTARDALPFQFKKSLREVPTGRRDGIISLLSEATENLPLPFSNFSTLQRMFANNHLDIHDLVVLSGAHTIGVGHCNLFSNRLYNFTGKGDADPMLDGSYAMFLKTICKNPQDNVTTVAMDPNGSSVAFNSHSYTNLKLNKRLFQSGSSFLTNQQASMIVDTLGDTNTFIAAFKDSITKMGKIGVLTGGEGEIRNCRVPN